MTLPQHLVLIRHAESEGNYVREQFKRAGESAVTAGFRDRPAHQWRLTAKGVGQAKEAGGWITRHVVDAYGLDGFDRYLYSPHRRTRETAAHLGLPRAQWRLARLLREREWGEVGGLMDPEHAALYPRNHAWMRADPLNWAPPGGESISQVADNRVRELCDSLHREHTDKGVESVLAVTHGDFIWASRLLLDYMLNEDWDASELDPTVKVHNCQVVHWTRLHPSTGEPAPYLRWSRSVDPLADPDDPGVWKEASRRTLSNDELQAQVQLLPRL